MALSGSQQAYLQARSGLARSGASRSNYVVPLFGVITVNGVDLTAHIRYHSLKVNLALNEQPDRASFEVFLTDPAVQAALVVGADVVIGLGGATENPVFGGRILTAQTTRLKGHAPSVRALMCADYLQVLDSEYLITYDWPAQSATVTIKDLIARFAGKPGGVVISTAAVAAGLPNHAAVGVINEKFSTVLRRLVTTFPTGGGFYIDPLKVLHVWAGASEPGVQNPGTLTLAHPLLKGFAETVDGSQVRDAVLVEGLRTSAPAGSPGPGGGIYDIQSIPVADGSILDKVTDAGVLREVRIATQRVAFRIAQGAWTSPANTPQSASVTTDVLYAPGPGTVTILLDSYAMFNQRNFNSWVKVDEQYLRTTYAGGALTVPRDGFGSLNAPIKAGATMTMVDSLAEGYITGRYDAPGSPEKVRPQPKDSDVVMTVRTSTAPAIHEHIVQDGRYSRAGAANRGAAEIAQFAQPLVSIQWETDDLNAKPGRVQAYDFEEPPLAPMTGHYMIVSVELTWPVWGLPPRRACYGADVQAADVVDAWLVDRK